MEQRRHHRYQLEAAVSFTWERSDRVVLHGSGITRDFSISGAFVVTTSQLAVGSALQMEFSLPPLHADGRGARLSTRGHVVRSESNGFAVDADMGPRLQREVMSYAQAL